MQEPAQMEAGWLTPQARAECRRLPEQCGDDLVMPALETAPSSPALLCRSGNPAQHGPLDPEGGQADAATAAGWWCLSAPPGASSASRAGRWSRCTMSWFTITAGWGPEDSGGTAVPQPHSPAVHVAIFCWMDRPRTWNLEEADMAGFSVLRLGGWWLALEEPLGDANQTPLTPWGQAQAWRSGLEPGSSS